VRRERPAYGSSVGLAKPIKSDSRCRAEARIDEDFDRIGRDASFIALMDEDEQAGTADQQPETRR